MHSSSAHLQLDIIVQQPDFLTWLERRQANVRAPIASESVAQRAVSAAAHFALHCEIDFVEEVVGTKLHRVERFVGIGALRGIFGFELLFHAAGAVFAGAAALAGLGAAFEGCSRLVGV